jgi:hypothetical protein
MSVDFGRAVAGAGDMDGDGRSDFVVGAPGSMGGAGRVLFFLGTPAFSSGAVWRVSGFGTSLYFGAGASVATGGDIDGDGLSDVAFGGPNYSSGAVTGSAFVALSGSAPPFSRTWLTLPTMPAATLAWGTAVLIGDFDGNGYAYVAISDPRDTGGNFGVNVYPSAAGTLATTGFLLSLGFFDQFGASLAMSTASDRARRALTWSLIAPGRFLRSS